MLIRSVLCAQLGTEQWNSLQASNEQLYPWDEKSTYIHKYVLRTAHSPPSTPSLLMLPAPATARRSSRP